MHLKIKYKILSFSSSDHEALISEPYLPLGSGGSVHKAGPWGGGVALAASNLNYTLLLTLASFLGNRRARDAPFFALNRCSEPAHSQC